MSLPREERFDDLGGGAVYAERLGVRLIKDLEELGSSQVVIVVGNQWTVLGGQEFRQLAARLLRQLE